MRGIFLGEQREIDWFIEGMGNFFPEARDICDWNNNYWEINGVTEPQLIGGNPNFSHAIKATAHRSRLSSLQIEERPR